MTQHKLVIAEKPSVAQTIAKAIGASNRNDGYIEGNGYIVSWCVGHLVSAAPPESYDEKYKKWDNLPIVPTVWKYEVLPATKKQFGILKKLMNSSKVDTVICATDAGREGELIFRHVYNEAGCKKPIERLWVSSLEDEAIKKGFGNLKSGMEYNNLYQSALCRERADWLVGINATRHFTVKNGNNSVISIGRVQTPTLALIVERDSEIKNFKKGYYYTVEINCGLFKAVSRKFDVKDLAEAVKNNCKTAKVKEIRKETKAVVSPKLYDLTSLQRDANRMFGFTAQQTLDILQKLYETKLVTYPRTDSRYLTEDMGNTALSVINAITAATDFEISGEPNVKRIMNNACVSDHHAIIPTVNIKTADLSALDENSNKLLHLIGARLLAATAPKHEYEVTTVTLSATGCDFTATGKVIKNGGFKDVEMQLLTITKSKPADNEEKETVLPHISEDMEYPIVPAVIEHETTPPKHYSEDTLLSAMENAGSSDFVENCYERKGLGTPATRASIIETLIKRGYVERKGKQLISTDKGAKVIFSVPEILRSAKMTAEWENELSQIAKGKADSKAFMHHIENFVRTILTV
ncbi:MAG: DNA topoisomerase 3 [Firmicutes bacterium]|nr:DNA topoisomerase 3 [Bacillota bacterium]